MTGAATPVDGIAIVAADSDTVESTEVVVATPTVDAVLEALSPAEEPEEPWSYDDPIFWALCRDLGDPGMSHPVDMVIRRGPHVRRITVFDAVVPDGRGRHR